MNVNFTKEEIKIIKQALNIALYMGKNDKDCTSYRNILKKLKEE